MAQSDRIPEVMPPGSRGTFEQSAVLAVGLSIRKRKVTQHGGKNKGSRPFLPPRQAGSSVC
jgi:hypothetical protein